MKIYKLTYHKFKPKGGVELIKAIFLYPQNNFLVQNILLQPWTVPCEHFENPKAKYFHRKKQLHIKGDILHININTLVQMQNKHKIISRSKSKSPNKVNIDSYENITEDQ